MVSSGTYSSGNNGQTYPCPNCAGSGTVVTNGKSKNCPTCFGQGFLSQKNHQKFLNAQPLATIPTKITFVNCPECGGTKEIQDPTNGKTIDCEFCEASGVVTEDTMKQWRKDNGGI